ncbi:MAG: family 1 glycosylhydrolase, partial [Flavobacterium sp.]
FDVRGYYYWTGVRGFEWRKGYSETYGLFDYNPETQERRLYKSAQPLVNFLRKQKDLPKITSTNPYDWSN